MNVFPLIPLIFRDFLKHILFFFVGSAKRYRTKAIQTSKHCNIICMYTTFTTTDGNPNKACPDHLDPQNPGDSHYELVNSLCAVYFQGKCYGMP